MNYFTNIHRLRVELRQKIEGSRYATWRKVYDGLGQLIQAQTVNATVDGGQWDVLVNYHYDPVGQLIRETMPFTDTVMVNPTWPLRLYSNPPTPPPPQTTMEYDALGRKARVTAADGTQTEFGYSDFTTVVTDTLGNATTTISDIWGRTSQVIPPSIAPGVTYTYDTMDRLVTASRGGATTTLTYDKSGRKLTMDDPDMGDWSYAYDALGNLIRQTDARGQRICMYYDNLNRLTGKYYQTGDNCPGSRPADAPVRFTYDQGTFGKGQRTSMFDPTGATTWNYDARGQVITQTQVITDGLGTFVTAWGYNAAGQQDWMKYPKNNLGEVEERIDYTYHNQLTLNSVLTTFPTAYVLNTFYDASGRLTERKMGNLGYLITQYSYYPWTTPNQGGRLQRIYSYDENNPPQPPSEPPLQDMRFTYDGIGNVTSIQDYWNLANGQPQELGFSYDALYRLRTAQATGGAFGSYSQEEYTYDALSGNLASKAGVSYAYGDADHKHAVTALSDGSQYTYDANGNMLTRTVGGQSFNLTHNAEGRLVSVSGAAAASFGYNADGQRVIANEGGTTRVFIGNYFEWTGSEATAVKYYYAVSTRVAMRTGSGGAQWLLGDHLGSASVTYDGTNDLHQGYYPWGETRFGGLPTKYQFTGQYRHADLGLDFFNARWYDGRLARFIEADTITPNQFNPLDWDRYSYARNNPAHFIDPTGHKPLGCTRDSIEDCSDQQILARYDVHLNGSTFNGSSWNDRRYSFLYHLAVILAITSVGDAFAKVLGNGISSSEAFQKVYSGGVTITWGTEGASSDCTVDTGSGGCTSSSGQINFFSLSKPLGKRTFDMALTNARNNIVHELGHAFGSELSEASKGPYTSIPSSLQKEGGFAASPVSAQRTWRQSTGTTAHEVFADMFLGWTYNAFGGNTLGNQRSGFMTDNMPTWVNMAASQ